MIGGDAGEGAPSGDAGHGAATGDAGRGASGHGAASGRGAASGDGPPVGGGVLYVVATPIGNLSDVTLRALEVLAAVPLIAAEDTRLSKRLLDRHGVSGRLTSYHARSGPGRLASLLEHLRGGADLALITDAGTPAVSDPGADLVAAWAGEGGRVVPIPGASAVLAAVAASGGDGATLVVRGVPAPLRAGAQGPVGGDRGRRPRSASCSRRPGGSRPRSGIWPRPAARGGPGRCAESSPSCTSRSCAARSENWSMAVGEGTIPARGEFVLVVGMGGNADGPGTITGGRGGRAGRRRRRARTGAGARGRGHAPG